MPKAPASKPTRKQRPYPVSTFEDALQLPKAILQHAPAGKIRRLTLFDELNRAPESGPSRQLITNSNAYGLTTGSYRADHLEITPDGRLALSSEETTETRLRARLRLAIEAIPPFNNLYEQFKGQKLPSKAVLRDFLIEKGLDDELVQECIDTFIANSEFLGLLQTVAGTEHLLAVPDE